MVEGKPNYLQSHTTSESFPGLRREWTSGASSQRTRIRERSRGRFVAVATELCFVSMRHEGWVGMIVNVLEEGSRAAGELDGSAQWFIIQRGHL